MNANNHNHTNGNQASEQPFSEAPASWNTRYLSPEGFECQITLRGEPGTELLEKATSAIAYLLKAGCLPSVYRRGNNVGSEAQEARNDNGSPAWCPIH